MRRKALVLLALVAVVVVLGAAATAGTGSRQPRGFSAVSMHPTAVAKYKAMGKAINFPFPNSVNQGRKFAPGGGVIGQLDTNPVQNVLVLFVDFATAPPGGPATRMDLGVYYDTLLFGTVYDPPDYAPYHAYYINTYGVDAVPTDRTLYNFYQANSYGKVTVTTFNKPSTLGWLHLPGTYASYNANPGAMVREAVLAAHAAGVDFSKYAIGGELPNLFVVHAGSGGEWAGDPALIWSHSWSLTYALGAPMTVDGVVIDSYATMPEVGGDTTNYLGIAGYTGPFAPTFGVFAHEYGHVLGVPDQYDYGYDGEGTGPYSLMSLGSWNQYPWDYIFAGNSPANLDAWSKYRLGFVNPIEITDAQSVTLMPAEISDKVYKMVVPFSGGKEYYLFENRQFLGTDVGMWNIGNGMHGLVIYHIDDVVLSRSYWRPNEANNWREFRSLGWQKASTGETHYGISIIQADDRWEMEKGYYLYLGDYSRSGDLYPGHWGVHSFGTYTFPNSSSYYFWGGSDPKFGYSGVTVENIQENNGVVTADFSFVPYNPPAKR